VERDFQYRIFLQAWLQLNGNAKLERIVSEATGRGITREQAMAAAQRANEQFLSGDVPQRQGKTFHVPHPWSARLAFNEALDNLVREREENEAHHEETPPADLALERAMKLVSSSRQEATETALVDLVAGALGPDAPEDAIDRVISHLAGYCEVQEAQS
jgi:hypothetical protein